MEDPEKKRKKKGESSLIVKSNYLINAHYHLTTVEMRIVYAMAMQVKKDDKDFQTYRLRIKDFADVVGVSSENLYVRIQQKTEQLMKRVLNIPQENGNLLQVSLLSRAYYHKDEGVVDLRFDPDLKPYLLDLKSRFTSFYSHNVLSLQSAHSMRIYELLKSYEKIGERTEKVEELKKLLGIEGKYRSYNVFKKRVILQAQKDLADHCDIRFDFDELKQGRRIHRIRFYITRQEARPEPFPEIKLEPREDTAEDIILELVNMGLSREQAAKFEQELDYDLILEKIHQVQKGFEAGKIKKPAAYLVTLLEKSEAGVSVYEKNQKKKQELEKETRQKELTRQKLKQEREKQDQLLIDAVFTEFKAARQQRIKKLLEMAGKEEHQGFRNYISGVPYLKSKFLDGGNLKTGHKDFLYWFGLYLADNKLPEEEGAFIDWAYQRHGLQLERNRNGDGYRIIARQESLF